MDDRTRRTRVAVSAMLLALGFCAFLVSLSMPGVTKRHDGRTLGRCTLVEDFDFVNLTFTQASRKVFRGRRQHGFSLLGGDTFRD